MKTTTIRILVCILVSLCLLTTAACDGAPPPPTSLPSASTPASPSPSATAAAVSPSPRPTGATVVTSAPDGGDAAMAARLAAAPPLPGAETEIAEAGGLRRVFYTASENNPYGVSAGTFLGEYKDEVWLDDRQTGGVALVPAALLPLLAASIDALPDGAEPWLLPLPVDLTDCSSYRPVRIDRNASPFSDEPYYIRTTVEEETLGVTNIVMGDQPLVIESFVIYDLDFIVSRTSYDTRKIQPGLEMSYLFVVADLIDPVRSGRDEPVAFGARIGAAVKPVLAGLSSVRGPLREHTFACLLYLEDCPVFAASP